MPVSIFEGEGPPYECDFFVAVRERVVIVVDGSEAVAVFRVRWVRASTWKWGLHFATPREIDTAGDTDPPELVNKVSPMRFYVACPAVCV